MPNLQPGGRLQAAVQGVGTYTEPSGLTELKSQKSEFWKIKTVRISGAENQRGERYTEKRYYRYAKGCLLASLAKSSSAHVWKETAQDQRKNH